MGGSGGAFHSTLWSLVLRAKNPEAPDRREALQKLIQTYWKPLYLFVRRKGTPVEASKDLIQSFFSDLLAKDFLKYLDRERGRFRTFLLTALDHYRSDQYDHDRARKRGGGQPLLSLNFEEADENLPLKAGENPDRAYVREWAVGVLSQAMDAVQAYYSSSSRSAEFEAFKLHLTSTHPDGASYEEMARTLGISMDDVRNRIRSARTRYREAILEVIRSYTDSEREAREELNELLCAFS